MEATYHKYSPAAKSTFFSFFNGCTWRLILTDKSPTQNCHHANMDCFVQIIGLFENSLLYPKTHVWWWLSSPLGLPHIGIHPEISNPYLETNPWWYQPFNFCHPQFISWLNQFNELDISTRNPPYFCEINQITAFIAYCRGLYLPDWGSL